MHRVPPNDRQPAILLVFCHCQDVAGCRLRVHSGRLFDRRGLYGAIPGDNRPHKGVDRACNMPIQGIDVARYQENVDFRAAFGAGIHFVFMKATEGKDYIDPNFRVNWERARQSGMPRGAYHFMTRCSLASEQAAWFMANVPNDPDALPPVLDLEWNNHSSCRNKPSRADALEKIRVMLDAMERHTGKLPIIYTDMNFHRDILDGEYFPNAFWLRSTAAEPHERYNNRTGPSGSGPRPGWCAACAGKWIAMPSMATRMTG
ncbi:GH25 family lysozyme [Devosia sp. A8/3-2]|nr:GH25 family lysozyme [Devosia sp. A8/3-2]